MGGGSGRRRARRAGRLQLLLLCVALAAPAQAESGSESSRSGSYEVTGVTIDSKTGVQRPIRGRILLREEGARYSAKFELATVFPGSDAAAAVVVGTGEGDVEGSTLRGTADIQIVRTSVPGVDVGFAYLPREVGPRVRSQSVARFLDDGTLRVDLENRPAEGEDYAPTRTQLVGYRGDPGPGAR